MISGSLTGCQVTFECSAVFIFFRFVGAQRHTFYMSVQVVTSCFQFGVSTTICAAFVVKQRNVEQWHHLSTSKGTVARMGGDSSLLVLSCPAWDYPATRFHHVTAFLAVQGLAIVFYFFMGPARWSDWAPPVHPPFTWALQNFNITLSMQVVNKQCPTALVWSHPAWLCIGPTLASDRHPTWHVLLPICTDVYQHVFSSAPHLCVKYPTCSNVLLNIASNLSPTCMQQLFVCNNTYQRTCCCCCMAAVH